MAKTLVNKLNIQIPSITLTLNSRDSHSTNSISRRMGSKVFILVRVSLAFHLVAVNKMGVLISNYCIFLVYCLRDESRDESVAMLLSNRYFTSFR